MNQTYRIQVKEDQSGRIDKFLSDEYPDFSRARIQKLLKDGKILVNGKSVKASYLIEYKDLIEINEPEPIIPDILPENIPLDIIYEDEDVILINKGKNMVVHPAPGHYEHTLVNALMYHCGKELSGINGVLRPGIVHRIDRDTTGVLIVCKNDKAHLSLAEQLKAHSITRKYVAIVHHHISSCDGTVEGAIGRHPTDRKKMAIEPVHGKPAVTHYHVLSNLKKPYAYIECQLETGRTHQIRVHMSSIGHPILGDPVYGPAKCPFHLEGQTLHAKVFGFVHPSTGQYMEFSAPLPDYFKKLLNDLDS
ncbi:MAG: RluA family pseudouridine synthase [Clostridiales bacterium]|nr:RluA family pseudouridine synthase [Clostridiales bacterium]